MAKHPKIATCQIAKFHDFLNNGNRHIVAKDTPTANLLLAMAHVGGVEIESLPAGTGRIDL